MPSDVALSSFLPHFMASFIILPLLCNHVITQIKDKEKQKIMYIHTEQIAFYGLLLGKWDKNIQEEKSGNNLKET